MSFIKNMIFLFKHSWYMSKRSFIVAIIDIVLGTVNPFIYLIFPKLIVDELTGNKDWNTVLFYIGAFIGCIVILNILKIALNIFTNMTVNRCDVKTGIFYARHFLNMDYDKLEDGAIRDLQGKVSSHVRVNIFIDTITNFLTALFKLIGFSYIIVMLHPVVLILILVVTVIHYFINKKSSKDNYEFQSVIAKYSRKFDYLFSVMTLFDFAKEVRVNKVDTTLKNKFERTHQQFDNVHKKLLTKQSVMNVWSAVLSFIQMIASYGYAAYLVIINAITVGSFNMYIGAIYNLSGSFSSVVSQAINLHYMSKYVDDYNKYIEMALPQNKDAEVNMLPAENNDVPIIEYDDVSFIYPNTTKRVLNHISIKLYKGEKLSVVGLNGSGKTTFIKLLCRLYKPTEGCIKFYGVDISTINRSEYMKLLSVVFQDFKIFSFSFLDNIILNKKFDEERFDKAVKNSGIKNKLDSLAKGVNTNIYKDFDEDGVELSGGEGQKLVIARAYYKNAPIVIFDEPTAALDALAENEIYQNMNEIMDGKTSIFISHRLASTRFCDKIAVFKGGSIVEYGTHNELMSVKGLYREMFEKQASYYMNEEEQ